MLIDISKIKSSTGDVLVIDTELDISELDPAFSDVKVEGKIKNIAGVLTIKAVISGTYTAVCDRCMEEASLKLEAKLDTIFDINEAKDDSLTLENGKIDLIRTAYDALSLEIPMVILCKEDCKGICPHCGKNLNLEECDCAEDEE
ncbi:MAG: DUF177 domain-containing protein [Ruminococcaceae bacterium]|nr:DUF177 domain-containing protein [Oscillospiraceae bacterium]